MNKYDVLWEYLRSCTEPVTELSFDEIREITGYEIDHSFLNYKRDAVNYGYEVGKISLKNKTVKFVCLSNVENQEKKA